MITSHHITPHYITAHHTTPHHTTTCNHILTLSLFNAAEDGQGPPPSSLAVAAYLRSLTFWSHTALQWRRQCVVPHQVCVRLCAAVYVCAWLCTSVSLHAWVGVHMWVIVRLRFVANVSVMCVCAWRRIVSWPGLQIIYMRVRHWLSYPSMSMAPSQAPLFLQYNATV